MNNFYTKTLHTANKTKLQEIYEDFRLKAPKNYHYEIEPVNFERFWENLEQNLLNGFILFSEKETPEGLLVYAPEPPESAEINVIHLKNNAEFDLKKRLLLEPLIKQFYSSPEWKFISYPMLGEQENFVREIVSFGFKLVGQCVVRFDLKDPVSYQVLKTSVVPELPQEYKFSEWKEEFSEQVAEIIHLAFKNSKNANFDPEFLTIEGSTEILQRITNGIFGSFLSSQSRVIYGADRVEGFCFAVVSSEDKINIPLIAIRKDNRHKGLGKLLLKSTLSGLLYAIGAQKFPFKEINATVDTDNYPAVKMYRRLGFVEDYYYPHAYIKRIKK